MVATAYDAICAGKPEKLSVEIGAAGVPTEHRPGFVEITGSQTVPAAAGSFGALHCGKR
jgi:hypothetical protein